MSRSEDKSWPELKREWIDYDGAINPRRGADTMRKLAFMAWCPSCQEGDHWNHLEDDGSCRSIERVRGARCTCPTRP